MGCPHTGDIFALEGCWGADIIRGCCGAGNDHVHIILALEAWEVSLDFCEGQMVCLFLEASFLHFQLLEVQAQEAQVFIVTVFFKFMGREAVTFKMGPISAAVAFQGVFFAFLEAKWAGTGMAVGLCTCVFLGP